MTDTKTLADRIEDLLPQTQCTKCGYAACRPYAEAIAQGTADFNQCPPGGHEGIVRLAGLLGRSVISLNPEHGEERPRPLAVIDENICIGCTLCIQACPVDAIVGAPKQMHTVLAALCTGCDLCVAPCPVDCIEMVPVTGSATGWRAWSPQQAAAARLRHDRHLARLAREQAAAEQRSAARLAARAPAPAETGAAAASGTAPEDVAQAQKRAIIQAALERARQKKEAAAAQGFQPKNIDATSRQTQAQIDAAEARRRKLGLAGSDTSDRSDRPDTPDGPATPDSPATPDAKQP